MPCGANATGASPLSLAARDALHARLLVDRQHAHPVAGTHAAARDQACESSEIEVRPQHHLHGQAEGRVGARAVDGHPLRELEHRRARVPWRAGAAAHHVVAVERADWNLCSETPSRLQRSIGAADAPE
jgi:hypothetical protein